jgi:tellurite resistance protein TerC
MTAGETRIDPEKNPVVRLAQKLLPFTNSYSGQRFFCPTREGNRKRLMATPLFLVLIVIETTDLVFAVDSIPAIFAVTRDPFIVYTSNVFAILGLRSLFFILAGMLDKFEYLKPGVAAILIFVGIKMVLAKWVHLPISLSLGIILGTLTIAVLLSIRKARRTAASA